MAWIPGGAFTMGYNDHYPEEAPAHRVVVDGFWVDRTAVTNAQFLKFVKATGHRTLAEQAADPTLYPDARPDLLQPSSIVFVPPPGPVAKGDPYRWWQYVAGADWRHPEGPGSSIKGREQHPVVHIAHADALAYAAWIGKQLPSEAEWERAARGGLEGVEFAWGEELHPGGRMLANTWQGDFPHHNSRADGWERTAPVGQYPANGNGLLDMIGNVWEWTDDWYQEHGARLEAIRRQPTTDPGDISAQACCGGLLGTAMVVAEKIQASDPHAGFQLRLAMLGCLVVAGAIGGSSFSLDAANPGRRRPKDTLRSASALTTGIFAALVTLTFLHAGLDQARTVSSRLSTSLTILVLSLSGPGWLAHQLSPGWRHRRKLGPLGRSFRRGRHELGGEAERGQP
ncbi:MAG: formylglycine-generating enzyme family protein [Cyanobacteria bacterium K_Offshore_surface_m2_239]|nr:formylglycine-generating enzyme family protein [Cyanobacteria bacterium K_Offshore_surface_m2_239]